MLHRNLSKSVKTALTLGGFIATQSLLSLTGLAGEKTTPQGLLSEKFVNFASTNVSYLYGFNWDTPFAPAKERDIITIEHFNDNKIGDLYFFVDFSNLATKDRGFPESDLDIYGEISPRISLSKITGTSFKFGIIKDILIYSGTLEFGNSGSLDNVNKRFGTQIDTTHFAQLHGAAIDFDLPGFTVAQLNGYWRDDTDQSGSTWQVTAVWSIPFKLFGTSWCFKGFADFNGAEGDLKETFHTSPQLVLDVGELLFGKKDTVLLGTEVDIWVNEFGVDGQNDVVPQAMIQFYF